MNQTIINTAETIIKEFPKTRTNTDPYVVLITTILSQRSKDENTEKASNQLFQDGWDVYEVAKKDPEELYDKIKPSGMYRQKAKNIVETSKVLIKEYQGKVPPDIEKLIQLPGVGRKTANIVLWISFGIPAMAVDTHVHRIANRLGWINTKTPEKSEYALMEILPSRLWGPINGSMVEFGKAICKPRTPLCSLCPINQSCQYYLSGEEPK
ncbi:MAG: endonuclease [Thermotogaceae bacterium]|nr:endonuclease [Thermotogaceae bacterium]